MFCETHREFGEHFPSQQFAVRNFWLLKFTKVMVSQLVIFSLHVVPLIAVWVALLYDWLPYTHDFTKKYYEFILYFPVYAVFLLAVYAICNVLYGVATFNDCPEAREELKKEIDDAKADLKRRNIIS